MLDLGHLPSSALTLPSLHGMCTMRPVLFHGEGGEAGPHPPGPVRFGGTVAQGPASLERAARAGGVVARPKDTAARGSQVCLRSWGQHPPGRPPSLDLYAEDHCVSHWQCRAWGWCLGPH